MKMTLVAFVLAVFSPAVRATDYDIDPAHTQVGFKAKHIVGKVPGRFTKFSGRFSYDPKDPAAWKAEATIDPASINTDNDRRDAHLRSADFFDVAKCPMMSFKSTGVTQVTKDRAKLQGELTMHCKTLPVVLDLEVDGVEKDPWGGLTASFSARGSIDRKDWGINWNKALDSGGVLVGDRIEIELEVSGNERKAAAGKSKG